MNTQKKQTVEAMQSQIDFLTKKLDFISHNAETVLQGKTIKETIKDILRSIRDYYNADSAYIFEINYKDNRIINTFETYAKGVDAAEDAVPGAREEILTGRIKATDAEITALAKTPKAEIPAALAELRKPKQERQPRKAETASSKQTLSEISKSIQGHQRQLTTEERTFLKASIDNRYQERAVANGSLMMCEVQGAKEDFIRRWNSIFKEYPDVFEDSDCRKIIHDLTEDAVQYLLKIKEKTL